MKEEGVDFILSPTAFGAKPQKIDEVLNGMKEEENDPISEYKMDYFTAGANCLGVPALTMPIIEDPEALEKHDGFPGSIRLQGYFGEDYHLLRCANKIERIL